MIRRVSVAAVVALLGATPVSAQTPEGGPWRLQRLYAPTPERHDPFRFWVSAADLEAAAGQQRPRVRMLVLNDDGGWSIIAAEHHCGEGLVRRLEGRRLDSAGRVMFADAYPPDLVRPGALDPEHLIYGVVCDGGEAGAEEVATLARARAVETGDRARSLAAIAAAEAAQAVEEPPCRGNVLRNPFFAITGRPADGSGDAIERTFMGAPQTLWAWRSAGGAPRWPSPDTPDQGPLYLGTGQAIVQSEVGATAGRWRLTVAAAASDPSGGALRALLGDDGAVFDVPLALASTTVVIEADLAKDADRLVLTATGPGEVRLQMACLRPLP